MSEKDTKKLAELNQEIDLCHKQIQELEEEFNKIAMKDIGTFKGSYIEYYDANTGDYTYMHVREEHPMDSMNGRIMDSRLMLLGSGLILDYDALSDGVDKEGMEMAICDSFKEIYLTLNTLTGKSASTIKKISKENFDNIFESWVAIMRKIIISEG